MTTLRVFFTICSITSSGTSVASPSVATAALVDIASAAIQTPDRQRKRAHQDINNEGATRN
jgi:hypothetical protein